MFLFSSFRSSQNNRYSRPIHQIAWSLINMFKNRINSCFVLILSILLSIITKRFYHAHLNISKPDLKSILQYRMLHLYNWALASRFTIGCLLAPGAAWPATQPLPCAAESSAQRRTWMSSPDRGSQWGRSLLRPARGKTRRGFGARRYVPAGSSGTLGNLFLWEKSLRRKLEEW